MANVENKEQDEEKVETISEQQLLALRQAFSSIDQNNDGLVRVKDLPNIFKRLDEDCESFIIQSNELEHLLEMNNIDESDQITFTQFLTLIACKVNVNDTLEELQEAFSVFDPTNSGFITTKDLVRVMSKIGEIISQAEAEEMMRHGDRDLDGKISFSEFIDLLRYS